MNKDNILKVVAVALFGGLFWVFSQNRFRKMYSQGAVTGGDGDPLPDDGEPGIGEGNDCGAGPYTEALDLQPYAGDNYTQPYVYLSNIVLSDSSQQSAGTDAIEQWYVGARLQVINPCNGGIEYDIDLENFMGAYYAGALTTQTVDVSFKNIAVDGQGTPQFQVTQFKVQLPSQMARGLYDIVLTQGATRAPFTTAYGIQPDGTYEGLELPIYYCGVVPENFTITQANKQF